MSDDSQSDLHPGGATTSIWHGTTEVPRFPKLEHDTRTDVCVVGAGIAGLSVAYHLAREGKGVVVLDDGPIGGGETGRTTAHLTDAIDDRLYWLEKVHGPDAARLAAASHSAAINRIQQIVNLEGIDCDFERLDGYLVPGDPADAGELRREADAAQRAGMTDVTLVERAPIAGFESGAALRFPGQGQFHALKYVTGLANAIVQKYHGRIFCGTHVEGIEGGDPCTVKITGGHTVTAGCVVACTNSSISDYVRTHLLMEPMRTYVIAAVVARGSVERALFWDTSDPYHYARVLSLAERQPGALSGGDDGEWDSLIVGGEDHKVGHDASATDRWDRLEQWMRQRWPHAREVIYKWSGQVLEPTDGLAYIGRNPDGARNVFMASGDSGQGMTHGTIAGMLLCDMLLGRPHVWEELYDPRRLTLRVEPMAETAKHNLDVAVQFARGYLASDRAAVDDVLPGEGRVIRRGGKRIAVYRDADGQLHEKSAVCTHLKCIVEWNAVEKSWDCPCHGSRFAATGEVLNGPAINGLQDVAPEPTPRAPRRRRRAKT